MFHFSASSSPFMFSVSMNDQRFSPLPGSRRGRGGGVPKYELWESHKRNPMLSTLAAALVTLFLCGRLQSVDDFSLVVVLLRWQYFRVQFPSPFCVYYIFSYVFFHFRAHTVSSYRRPCHGRYYTPTAIDIQNETTSSRSNSQQEQ